MPSFPDPDPGGGISLPSSIDTRSPAFLSAQAACRALFPGALPGLHEPPAAGAVQQLLATSRCMRAHGVAGFPDPVTTPPNLGGAYSLVMRRGGAYVAVPSTIDIGSPSFTHAARACAFGPRRGAKASAAVPG